jgi:hypothetical protein
LGIDKEMERDEDYRITLGSPQLAGNCRHWLQAIGRVFRYFQPHKYKNGLQFDLEADIPTGLRRPFRQAEPDETAVRMIVCEELK